jgi:glucose-6-phosphate 1-dehydrogenase
VSEIAVQFRGAPLRLFRDRDVTSVEPNALVIRIQPEEGIALRLQAKIPGEQFRLGAVDMNFDYADYFASRPNTGYETLLHDCLMGDQTLFHRADMVEAGWTVVAPMLDLVAAEPSALLHGYPAQSWGPEAADRLLSGDGRQWRTNGAPVTPATAAS